MPPIVKSWKSPPNIDGNCSVDKEVYHYYFRLENEDKPLHLKNNSKQIHIYQYSKYIVQVNYKFLENQSIDSSTSPSI